MPSREARYASRPMTIEFLKADLAAEDHRSAILELTRDYAMDPMGNGSDLPDEVRARLLDGLERHPTTLILLAKADGAFAGIATCFIGFSTFGAAPVVNIHDLHVRSAFRRRGIARQLLGAVEREARRIGACKLTLEVQQKNRPARSLYAAFGFSEGRYDDGAGTVLFRQKRLQEAGNEEGERG